MNRMHGRVNFHLSQVLTGHGFFRQYVHSKKFTRSPDCPACPDVVESPEHVLFRCPRFAELRGRLLTGHGLQPATADNLLDYQLHSSESWDRVDEVATAITREMQRIWTAERGAEAEQELREGDRADSGGIQRSVQGF